MIPTARNAWQPFSSVHIPEGFHYNSILEYYNDIPQVNYSYKEGVRQVSEPFPILHEDSTDDDDRDCDTDSETA